MQPQTDNPNQIPNSNPPENPVPKIELTSAPTPSPSVPNQVPEPLAVTATQPNAVPAPTQVSPIQPTVAPINPPTMEPRPQPSVQPSVSVSETPGPVAFGPSVAAPATSLTAQESIAPNVVGANLPGTPGNGTMFVGGDGGLQTVAAAGNTKLHYPSATRKKALIGGGVSAGVLMAAALIFFGFYVPNTPENVWKTGMNRTGKQMTALIETMSDPKTAAELEKTELAMKGTLDVNGKESTLSINTTGDETKTNTSAKVNVNMADVPEMNLTADIKTQLPDDAVLPNLYFRIGGFTELGLDGFIPGINNYDNKWIAVEQDYLKQFEENFSTATSENAENMTQEDILSIVNDVNAVSQEYLFTSDPEKAVIKTGEFVATEESEGIKANHYKATIDKSNLKKYCVAMGTKLLSNKVVKDNDLLSETDEAEVKEGCKTAGDAIKTTDSFDLWIDKKYKLFHKVRFYEDLKAQAKKYQQEKDECIAEFQQYPDSQDPESYAYCNYYDDMIETGEAYTEFGQIYKGEDTFFLFAGFVSDTNKDNSKLRLEMTVDAKELTLDGKITFSTKSDGSNVKGEMTMNTEPYSGETDASKPEGAIPIQQVIDELSAAQPTEPEVDYFQTGAGIPIFQPVTSQFNQLKSWLQ